MLSSKAPATIALAVLLSAAALYADDVPDLTDGFTPPDIAAGPVLAGISLGEISNVNPFSGKATLNIPLRRISGRGEIGYTISALIGQDWIIDRVNPFGTEYQNPVPTSWATVRPGYGPGILEGRYAVDTGNACPGKRVHSMVSRITFKGNGGGEVELRDELTNGEPYDPPNPCNWGTFNRGKTFISGDGSGVTFVSDTDIIDDGDPGSFNPSGTLYLANGSRYTVVGGLITKMKDRFGNYMLLEYNEPTNYSMPTKITDSLGRITTIATQTINCGGAEYCDSITYKGQNGANRTVWVYYDFLDDVIDTGSATTYGYLFPAMNMNISGTFNPLKVSKITTPAGDYTFTYNRFGEHVEIEFPTDMRMEFDYTPFSGGASADFSAMVRRVTEVRTYLHGTTLAGKTTYSRVDTTDCQPFGTMEGSVATVKHFDTNGSTVLAKEKHYYCGIPGENPNTDVADYAWWKRGRLYKTERLSGSTVLQTTLTTWEQRPGNPGENIWWSPGSDFAPAMDTRQQWIDSTLSEGGTLTSKQRFKYDAQNNQTDVHAYDYGSATPDRRSHTEYETSSSYLDTPRHIRGLVKKRWQCGAGSGDCIESQAVAKTELVYDGSTPSSRSDAMHWDPIFSSVRGNVSSIKRWRDLPTGKWVTSTVRHDKLGNVLEVDDPEGNTTTVDYVDNFINSSTPELPSNKKAYAFLTSGSNELSHSVATQRDYYSGTTRKFTDANGVETTLEYWGSRDRLSKAVQAANHTSVSRNTKINYNTPSGVQLFESIWVKKDQYNVNDQSLIKITYYDNLGREAASRNKACAKVTKSFDGLSRLRKVTNPFTDCTETAPAPTGDLTERQYDALGRVKKVIAPGGAETVYSYAVNRTTVTDPAGKDRQLTYDAFGQLTKVIEDPGGLAYETYYSYNALGKLLEVQQGPEKGTQQIRTFTYDSLGRLLTADNPEDSGSISYAYDDNGNLTSKTDARSVTTTHIYDELNRLLKTTYSDGTPQEVRCYDGKQHNGTSCTAIFSVANSIGRATMSNSIWAARYITAFDPMGRVTADQSYVVHTDSPWTAGGYLFSYAYNRDGTLKSETLPSGRKIDYTYDVHGRPYSAGEAGGTSYVNSTAYTTHGALDNLQWGNLLTEQKCYNNRLQPTAMRLGTGTQTNCAHQSTDKLHLAYGFGTATANNGNMLQQTITASSTQAWTQYYAHDELNRLSMASENAVITGSSCPAGATWCRGYGFDPFANRWVSASLDTLHMATPTSSAAVNAATNRLTSGTYDAAGNMTAYPFLTDGGSMVYDANNKMTSFTKTGVSVATKYDSGGKRVRKIYNTETTVWVYDRFGRLAAEYRNGTGAGFASGSPDKEYVYFGGKLAAVRDASNVHYRTTDRLGSTRVITDGTGGVKQRRDHFPFGEEIPADTSHGSRNLVLDGGTATYNVMTGVRQQFTEQQRDSETGLDYYWARNYASILGKFSSIDPENAGADGQNPQGWNAYTLTLNRPLRFVDLTGREQGDPECHLEDGSDEIAETRWVCPGDEITVIASAPEDVITVPSPIGTNGSFSGSSDGTGLDNGSGGAPEESTASEPAEESTEPPQLPSCLADVFWPTFRDAMNPFLPGASTVGTAAGGVASGVLWNQALEYGRTRPSRRFRTPSLIYPLKSSTFRNMLRRSRAAGAAGVLVSINIALALGVAEEYRAAMEGKCQ